MQTKLPTVSIAIPAFNEEGNIKNLLQNLLHQQEENFILKEIIVLSDGSTDNTVSEVRSIINKKIEVISSHERLGKSQRLNELFTLFTGEILILLDADVIPANDTTLKELIQPLDHPNVQLVSGKPIQAPPTTHFEKIMAISLFLQDYIKSHINKGDNIYACHGRIMALRKKFAKEISIPPTSSSNDAIIFLENKKRNYGFKYASKAQVFFRMPTSYTDFLKQRKRFTSAHDELTKRFGKMVVKEYFIEKKYILGAVIHAFFHAPYYSTLYFCVLFLSTYHKNTNTTVNALWEISESTKKV